MVPFSFAGETFYPSAEGALFWPREQAILVADLHLEKASWFARLGQFLPPYDSHATLTALARQIDRTNARRLFCLGDSFHDAFGCERLPANARALLIGLTVMDNATRFPLANPPGARGALPLGGADRDPPPMAGEGAVLHGR